MAATAALATLTGPWIDMRWGWSPAAQSGTIFSQEAGPERLVSSCASRHFPPPASLGHECDSWGAKGNCAAKQECEGSP